MKINCEYCGEEFIVNDKRWGKHIRKSNDGKHKIARCPSCFQKNIYSILGKYSEKY